MRAPIIINIIQSNFLMPFNFASSVALLAIPIVALIKAVKRVKMETDSF